ncbi:MAG: hypothetical protein KF894_29100 [Labilithrix sp.]|nr:hypothetical protein [Labilithrix sp.]
MAELGAWERLVFGVVCAASVLGWTARDARAAEDAGAARFHLAYEAPTGCPERKDFLAAIHARTTRPELAAPGESAPELTVSIEAAGDRTVGRLDVLEPGGEPQRRTVASRTCAEVAKALALVAALLLDPDAHAGSDAIAEPPEPGPLDPAPPAARPRARQPRARRPERTRPDEDARRVALSAGIALGAIGGVGPAIAPRAGALFDVELAPRAPAAGVTLRLAPSFRVAADVAATSSDLASGAQHYLWLGGTLGACPARLSLGTHIRLAPCGALQIGVHSGRTTAVTNPTASSDPWLAPLAGVRLEWALGSSVSLELQGDVAFPLLRSRFFLAPSTTIFEMPGITGVGSLAARWHFR